MIFDETYYVPDALGILRFGVEHNYVQNRNPLLVRGDAHIFTHGGEFVVHPPFAKMLIAVGEWMFGLTPFGSKGDRFDPTRHEAVAHLTSAEVTEPTCVDVMRRGYLLGERLLRPALVAVADPE